MKEKMNGLKAEKVTTSMTPKPMKDSQIDLKINVNVKQFVLCQNNLEIPALTRNSAYVSSVAQYVPKSRFFRSSIGTAVTDLREVQQKCDNK